MKRLILVIFAAIMFLGGCESCDPDNYNSWGYNNCGEYNSFYDQYNPITYTTKVISEPPGARIELDNDYIGDAPLEIQWEGYPATGCFTRNHELRALPINEGQYTQYKFFDGTSLGVGRPKIPKTIFFDMNLVPVPRRYEIDIE